MVIGAMYREKFLTDTAYYRDEPASTGACTKPRITARRKLEYYTLLRNAVINPREQVLYKQTYGEV